MLASKEEINIVIYSFPINKELLLILVLRMLRKNITEKSHSSTPQETNFIEYSIQRHRRMKNSIYLN